MTRIFFRKKLIYIIFFVLFIPQMLFADGSEVITISASVGLLPPTPPGGTGSGGGGTIPNTTTIINFSGMGYPLSKVYILKDGQVAVSTISDKFAKFSVSTLIYNTGTYTFSIYGEDSSGRKSSFFSFPIYITEGTTVNIGNIFLSPTIDVNKSEVKRGDNLMIFGQSIPKNEIIISVYSDQEYLYKVISNAMGNYIYNLDTAIFELGNHQTKSKAILNTQTSLYATPVTFLVGNENKIKDQSACSLLRGDLNCDNHVNLIDFSVMAYWYKKINPPEKVDLNRDGKINLSDFSIMAFNWTG